MPTLVCRTDRIELQCDCGISNPLELVSFICRICKTSAGNDDVPSAKIALLYTPPPFLIVRYNETRAFPARENYNKKIKANPRCQIIY